MKDLKFAFQQLAKRPGSTAVMLTTLTLVMGAMSLALGVIQHERSRWMPFPEPGQVVRVWHQHEGDYRDSLPGDVYAEAAQSIQGFEAVAAQAYGQSYVLTGRGDPTSLSLQQVSPSIFDVTGIPPQLGRVFTQQEAREGNLDRLVISDELWEERFDRDPSIVGETVMLNQRPFTVVGVMPPAMEHNALFYGLDGWIPKDFESPSTFQQWTRIVGRRKPGVSSAQLDAELEAVLGPVFAKTISKSEKPTDDSRFLAARADWRPGNGLDGDVVFGTAIPVFILGIAGFNIANILLARMLARRHEFAVRFSLGASRRRIVRQLLTESVVLNLLGAGLGLIVAQWIHHSVQVLPLQAVWSPAVVAATCAFALIVGLAVGILPSMRATRGNLSMDLKDTAQAGTGGSLSRHRLRNVLVIGQVAMATALCLAAGLLVRSYVTKKQFQPNFATASLTTLTISPNDETFPEPDQRLLYVDQVRSRLEAVPGVESVAVSSSHPAVRYPFPTTIQFESGNIDNRRYRVSAVTLVDAQSLESTNTRLIKGRPITDRDVRGTPPVALVSQSFVDRHFDEGQEPIGIRIGIRAETDREWMTIVGVIPDQKYIGRQRRHGGEVFLSARQFAPPWVSWHFLVKTRAAPETLHATLRQTARSVDGNVPVNHPRTVDAAIEQAIRRDRAPMLTVLSIAGFGLAMAILGIYGVVAYSVTERTHEVGVRMALGADKGTVLAMMIRQGMRHSLVGLALGTIVGSLICLGIRENLYGIVPWDPITLVSVGVILFLTALAAAAIPSQRATRIDPIKALRYQ